MTILQNFLKYFVLKSFECNTKINNERIFDTFTNFNSTLKNYYQPTNELKSILFFYLYKNTGKIYMNILY